MTQDYFDRFFAGETLAASRLMSVVEAGGEEGEEVLNRLFPKVGSAYRIGVTGFTGAGKSTLVDAVSRRYRDAKKSVGVIAEDPSSPFTGGAILGDRVRMQQASDDGVFIRSIASRGSETGLSACATELADVLDAFGRDIIFLETIGIGQLEYRIRHIAHTTCVVVTPDAGDDVQSLKSGLMEVGEIFVVNKADRENAKRYADDLRSMIELRANSDWLPPVVETAGTSGEGIDELHDAIERHREYLSHDGRLEAKRAEALRNRMTLVADERLRKLFWENDYIRKKLDGMVDLVTAGKKSPYEAAREILEPFAINSRK